MNYKIASINLTPPQKNHLSEIFIAQTDAEKENLAGKLIAMVEIDSKKTEAIKILNFLLNFLQTSYYQNEKVILRQKLATLKVENIFESIISKLNQQLNAYLKAEKIKFNFKKINATIAVLYKNEIYFTSTGKNKVFLAYNEKNDEGEEEEKKYKMTEIKMSTEEAQPKEGVEEEKLFSNVMNGTLPQDSYFLLTNETLPEYLSKKQIIEIITTLPPAGAIQQIKNSLGNINSYVSFLGILIKNSSFPQINYADLNAEDSQDNSNSSIEGLNSTEDNTEKLLSPSGLINIKKIIKLPKLILKSTDKIKGSRLFPSSQTPLKQIRKIRLFSKITALLKNILIHTINFIFFIFKTLSNKQRLYFIFEKIKFNFQNFFNNHSNKIKRLSIWHKIVIIVFAITIAFFSYSTIKTKEVNNKIALEESYNKILNEIKQKQNQIEAKLIYNNEKDAKKLFKDIEKLLSELPKDNDEQIKKYDDLENKYKNQLEKVQHITRPDNVSELFDFKKDNSSASPNNMILSDDKIYVSDPQNNTVYIYNSAKKEATTITDLNDNFTNLSSATIINDAIYWLNESNVVELDLKSEQIRKLTINLRENSKIEDIDSYNNRLYVLDSGNNQIYRYSLSNGGFFTALPWINDSTDVKNSKSLSIDGFIYVLNKNGDVQKLLRGVKSKFELKPIEPPITNADKIFVSEQLEYIYILDKAESRIVVFKKNGSFITQYKLDSYGTLQQIGIDEQNKTIYFLAESKLYSIPAQHL